MHPGPHRPINTTMAVHVCSTCTAIVMLCAKSVRGMAGQATEASMGGSTPAINRIATTTARAMR